MSAAADIAPQLDLSFRRHPARGTWLDRRRFRWPYVLARGFRSQAAPAHQLLLVVQTASGAILAEDRLLQQIHVGPGAAAHVTTQGATPVYRASAGRSARDDIFLQVEADGWIDYQPELRILFPDASIAQRLRLRLPASGAALITDGFVLHDPENARRVFRRYASTWLLERPNGELLATDHTDLAGPVTFGGCRSGYVAHGTVWLAVARSSAWLDATSKDVATALAGQSGLYAGASPLPNDAGVAVRIAAIDGRHLRLGLHAARAMLRERLFANTSSTGASRWR